MILKPTLRRAALLLAMLFSAAPAFADQGSLCLPTTGTVSGLTVVQDVNAALQALVTSNSGASAPANPCAAAPQAGQFWLDGSGTPAHLRIFDGANFLDMGAVDAVSHIWTPPVGAGATTLASASTVNLGSVPQSFINISGTTTVTSFGSGMVLGSAKVVRATGAFSITYNATSMILPGAVSRSVSVGDTFLVVSLGGGNSLVVMYQPADGTPVSLIQTANIAASAITSAKIATNTVANSNLAQMATATVKGNASASTANAADLSTAQLRLLPGNAQDGLLHGLTLSNDSGTPASVIDVAAGAAASDDSTPTLMVLGSAFTKSITSSWAAGTGNGCFDTGSISTPSTVHFFEIGKLDGTVDILCSASATAPTMPSGYIDKRRLGSDLYASSALKLFQQDGDYFAWAFVDSNISGITGSKALTTIDVPSGIRVKVKLQGLMTSNTGTNSQVSINTWDGLNANVQSLLAVLGGGSIFIAAYPQIEQFTNLSAQIYMQSQGGGSNAYVMGWTDTRGR